MSKQNGKHIVIGIVCAGLHDTGAQNTLLSLINEAGSRGIKTIVITNFTYYHMDYSLAEIEIFDLIKKPVFDGLILMPETIKSREVWEKLLGEVKAEGIPFVCVDRDVPDCVSITFDYGGAFEQVVRHIIEVHKPKRINFIGGMENNSFSEERLDVFKKVLKDNGREFEPERFGYGQFWENPTIEVLDRFYNGETEPPDAIICVNDTEAMTVCNYLKQRDIDVPRDVIVSGFDGIEEEKYAFPRLTTAAIDLEGMAGKTFDLLETLLRGEAPAERLSVIPYSLRISQSCGCMHINEGDKVNKLLELFLERKNSERHERRMFEYSSHTGRLNDYDQFAHLMPEYCECPTWCCIDSGLLHDTDIDDEDGEIPDERNGRLTMIMHSENVEMEQHPETFVFDVPLAPDEILPDLDGIFDEHNALLFAPLSYQGKGMGHIAAVIDSEYFSFLFTQRLVSNTSQIFETLKSKIRMQNAYAKVAEMHLRDPMTGLYNRRGFYSRMAEFAQNGIQHFALFSVDLDRLKYINDTFGHDIGDKAIIKAAEIIEAAAGRDAVCSRFGGDEFIVVIRSGDTSERYIERVNAEAEAFNDTSSEPFELGMSIGMADLNISDHENIEIAMKDADQRMYECKRRHHTERR